jgi:hypothetical protein
MRGEDEAAGIWDVGVEENGEGGMDGGEEKQRSAWVKKLLEEIRNRQRRGLDWVVVGKWILKAIIGGRMLGKRGKGRKRKGFLEGMKRGRTYSEMKSKTRLEGVG